MEKKSLLKLLSMMVVLVMVMGMLGACSAEKVEEEVKDDVQKVEDEVENIAGDVKQKAEEIFAGAKEEVGVAENVSEEKIHEAIAYIEEHIVEPFKDGEVTEKLMHYGAYLKEVGAKIEGDGEHVISKLGSDVYELTHKVYTKAEEEGSEVTEALKKDITAGLEAVKGEKDKLVTEITGLFHKDAE